MIVVTGGAGFIGSCLQAGLVDQGHETAVIDRLGSDGKWRNLRRHPPSLLIHPDQCETFLASHPPIEAIVHLGAISSTTATDGDAAWASNVALSQHLWSWSVRARVPFLYASSAATYGDGARGFDDDLALIRHLQPLNLYGWSKQAFDLWVARRVAEGQTPPQWAGLKFFNVYGPNEYHKASMVSVVKVKYDEIRAGQRPRLFRSVHDGIADGGQSRDFIWVGDVVDVILWLLASPAVSGLFNVGTGVARSYRDLAVAVCHAAGAPAEIDYVDMPAALRDQYQSFTRADISRLRAAGYDGDFTSLETGVARYINDHLTRPDPYL